jgi:hypothetical protein
MTFCLKQHWTTRSSVLAVLVLVLVWQARYTISIHNPMYGWPVPFNNVSYGPRWSLRWRPSLLIFDAAVWLVLAWSVGYVAERWRRRPNLLQFSLRSLFAMQTVVAILLSFGWVEAYLGAHPDYHYMFPRHARWDWSGVTIWLDIGLFTDPPLFWPFVRIPIVLAIGCTVYTAGCLVCSAVQRIADKMHRGPSWCSPRSACLMDEIAGIPASQLADERAARPQKEPIGARVLVWLLVVMIVILSMATLGPPTVQ